MTSSSGIPPIFSGYPDYVKILEQLKYYHPGVEGLTNYSGISKADRVYPSQNNVIISLLIR